MNDDLAALLRLDRALDDLARAASGPGVGVGVPLGVTVGVGLGDTVGVGVGDVNPGVVTWFVSRVTAPVRARSRPVRLVPLTVVTEAPARRFPIKVLPLPSVTDVPA